MNRLALAIILLLIANTAQASYTPANPLPTANGGTGQATINPSTSINKVVAWMNAAPNAYPVVMAAPPTITAGANNVSPAFTAGTLIDLLSSSITKVGTWTATYSPGGNNFYIPPVTGGDGGNYGFFSFILDGSSFSIKSDGSMSYQVYVDGQPVSATATSSTSNSAGVPSPVDYVFPTRAVRHIVVHANLGYGVSGIWPGVYDTISPLDNSHGPTIAFMTDSYGYQSSSLAIGAFPVAFFAKANGFNPSNGNFILSAGGASGYVAEGIPHLSFQERLANLTALNPDLLETAGGINDGNGPTSLTFTGALTGATSGTLSSAWTNETGVYQVTFSDSSVRSVTLTGQATTATWTGAVTATASATVNINLQAAATAYFAAARAALPNAVLVACGTWNPNGTSTASASAKEVLIKAALQTVSGPWIFISNISGTWNASNGSSGTIGNAPWQTGDGRTLTFTGTLNAATSGTLTSNWNGNTGTGYNLYFDDGSVHTGGHLTNGSTAVSWTSAVTTTGVTEAEYTTTAGNSIFNIKQDGTHPTVIGSDDLGALVFEGIYLGMRSF